MNILNFNNEHDLAIDEKPHVHFSITRSHVGFFEESGLDTKLKYAIGILVVALAIMLLCKSLQKTIDEPHPTYFHLSA